MESGCLPEKRNREGRGGSNPQSGKGRDAQREDSETGGGSPWALSCVSFSACLRVNWWGVEKRLPERVREDRSRELTAGWDSARSHQPEWKARSAEQDDRTTHGILRWNFRPLKVSKKRVIHNSKEKKLTACKGRDWHQISYCQPGAKKGRTTLFEYKQDITLNWYPTKIKFKEKGKKRYFSDILEFTECISTDHLLKN